MNKFRYVDNDILCKYDLSEEFFSRLDFEIEDIIPLRKVFVLLTSDGKKILKLTDSSEERIKFINEALKYTSLKYNELLSYYEDKNGNIIYKSNKNNYVILNMIDGREAAFSNPVEIEMCTRAMANMHIASKGVFNTLQTEVVKGNLGEYLPYEFNKVKEELISIKEYVLRFRHKVEFDRLFLENVDNYINEIQKAVDLLAICNYNTLLEDFNKRVLCHNDLAHHNFIVDGDKIKIIDFDYCKIDTRAVDISNFALKVMKNNCYDMNTFKLIVKTYNSLDDLSKDEIKLIYAILSFPRDFTTITRDYYYKQKKWEYEVFLNRLKGKIENELYREDFIKKFILELSEYFY
ncbi:CotS family spore coat protein [uncultured Clostridium sp.]|uniref:CotS family spore coat protein n=1 Tax=uncultured Clostridium sp. TaxID=59620 RepID=UPI00258F3515|nr:CotS family spore coat protein [uncultured Clostridium sp.]